MSVDLADLTWPEYSAHLESGGAVILPIGALEQHGPHLPLGTDTMQAHEIARRVAERTRAVVAPPLPYGYKSHPVWGGGDVFPGTTSVRGATLVALVEDVVGAVIDDGCVRVVVLNGHIENYQFVAEGIDLATRARSAREARVLLARWAQFVSRATIEAMFPKGDPDWNREHAAVLETSTMLGVRPDLVRLDRMTDAPAEPSPPYTMFPQAPGVPHSGILLPAWDAAVEHGERIVADCVSGIVAAMEAEFGPGLAAGS